MQEEIEQKSFNLMISTTKLSARTVLRAIKAALRLYQSKASIITEPSACLTLLVLAKTSGVAESTPAFLSSAEVSVVR